MGIKLLIISACLIAGESVGAHAAVGDEVDVTKDEATYLTRADRALYLDKADDPTKGQLTATKEDRERIAKLAKAQAEAAKVASQPAQDLGQLIATAVGTAVKSALTAQAEAAAAAKPAGT